MRGSTLTPQRPYNLRSVSVKLLKIWYLPEKLFQKHFHVDFSRVTVPKKHLCAHVEDLARRGEIWLFAMFASCGDCSDDTTRLMISSPVWTLTTHIAISSHSKNPHIFSFSNVWRNNKHVSSNEAMIVVFVPKTFPRCCWTTAVCVTETVGAAARSKGCGSIA